MYMLFTIYSIQVNTGRLIKDKINNLVSTNNTSKYVNDRIVRLVFSCIFFLRSWGTACVRYLWARAAICKEPYKKCRSPRFAALTKAL